MPIFCISNVTGHHIPFLTKFLNLLPYSSPKTEQDEDTEFQIDEIFVIPDVGMIVGGIVMKGSIHVNSTYTLGPQSDGSFVEVVIESIQRQRYSVKEMTKGHAGTIRISTTSGKALVDAKSKGSGIKIHRGMVLLGCENPTATKTFTAQLEMIADEGSQGLSLGTIGKVHIGAIRQTALVKSVQPLKDKQYLVELELFQPEWVRPSLKLIFYFPSHGIKCAGTILS